jgi:hypothetical protein
MNKREFIQLGDRLRGTTSDLRWVLSCNFPKESVNDKIFSGLEKYAKIFKCIECNHWISIDERSGDSDFCQQCIDEQESEE